MAVPILLHLFHRQDSRRVAFPALRYLERMERDHARRIRTRQLLLLLVRVAIVLLVVGAGARLFVRGRGSAHPPTALAIVLDNSMSSGLVEGDRRVLDELKELAIRSIDAAGEDDRIWVLRAAEPWQAAVPGGRSEARRLVVETVATDAGADLSVALSRAAELVRTAGLEASEIHLLSDLQAAGFDAEVEGPAEGIPVVVWAPRREPPANRGLTSVLVGGGLAPLGGQRSEVTVRLEGSAADSALVPIRLVLDDQVRGAGEATSGTSLSMPLPPAPEGWVLGYADADPDDLRADDRRFFAFRARPAPLVAVAGNPGRFVTEAAGVLEGAGRLRPSTPSAADAVVSAAGEGLASVRSGAAVLIVPPEDPTLLPALNLRLAEGGVPWSLERRTGTGETQVSGSPLPEPFTDLTVHRWYRMELAGDPPAPPHTLAWAGQDPWAVEGTDARGRRYLLLASALDPESSSLPVSTEMVRFLDWFGGQWAAAGSGPHERIAGEPVPAPRAADRVVLPSGEEVEIDGTRMVRVTGRSGFYTFRSADGVVAVEAVNPPVEESDPTPLDARELEARVGAELTTVRREGAWTREVFRSRQGPELWRPLALAALLLLLTEAALAAPGRVRRAATSRSGGEAARGTA